MCKGNDRVYFSNLFFVLTYPPASWSLSQYSSLVLRNNNNIVARDAAAAASLSDIKRLTTFPATYFRVYTYCFATVAQLSHTKKKKKKFNVDSVILGCPANSRWIVLKQFC